MTPKISAKRAQRLFAVLCFIITAFWIGRMGDFFSFLSGPATLSGSVPEIVQRSQTIQHADPEAKLQIVVGLKANDEAVLDALITAQQDPAAPEYRQFLTVDEFTQRFAPTTGQVDDVVNFLTANGITVQRVFPNRMLIVAIGSISQLEKAFDVVINEYQLPGAIAHNTLAPPSKYFSNDRDPSVPGALKNIVQSVIGLNTLVAYESHTRMPHGRAPAATQATLTPRDIATAYDFPNGNNRHAPAELYSGRGVNLAIATANGYDRGDVETFWREQGISRTGAIIDVPINGKSKKFQDETTLDLELAGSQAPAANIYMYIAASPDFVDFALTYGQIVVDNRADVISVSWGLCESRAGWMVIGAEGLIFKEAAVQGIALFASAGDDGAYDCGADEKHPRLDVDYPSSDPHVTAVGGTTLHVKDSTRLYENTWENGGGGVSSHWHRPAWQSVPGLPLGDKRASSDVSLNANPWTGYAFYFEGKWLRIGGTSAAAPEWAALWTLVLEGTGERVGSPNVYIYAIGALDDLQYQKYFFDITSGDNGADVGPGYVAGPRWDVPSGWGTPDGVAIVDWMLHSAPKNRTPPIEKSLGQKHPGLKFSNVFSIPWGPVFR